MNLPPSRPNTRFFTDPFARLRPALTVNGFDNEGNHAWGYGLKQIIAQCQDPSSLEHSILKYVHFKANAHPDDEERDEPRPKAFHANHNSQVFQTRSFIALLTLVLEENNQTIPGINLGSHESAMVLLRDCLLADEKTHPLYANEILSGPDRVKWTTSLCNMARGLDLYLALENAYAHYGLDESQLLTESQKSDVLRRHLEAISQILEVVDSNIGIGALISGNWSLKMWAAAAYACLGTQHQNEAEARQLFVWFGRGLRRASPGDVEDKRHYWTYMSSSDVDGKIKDGQRTWSEGPYYLHFTLQDIIPFWHAIRMQQYLVAPEQEVDTADPFHNPWFTAPIHWMADISTPSGETPPFDDGNRRPMFNAAVMAWDGVYGDPALGKKMNWIFQRVSEADFRPAPRWKMLNPDLLLVHLSIPKATEVTPPAAIVGNRSIDTRGDEQIIIRKNINGQQHYICLHGEHDLVSIERGEGHEQPDQLQLLYYVDDRSLIMDAGYDRGFIHKNSSWNRYTDHNVMAFQDGHSGMTAPSRLTKNVSHTPVDFLYVDESTTDQLFVLRGKTRLKWRKGKRLFKPGYRNQADSRYERTVLFVADDEAPYLIDINQVVHEKRRGTIPHLTMRYHADSNNFKKGLPQDWHTWLAHEEDDLHFFFDRVEQPAARGRMRIDQVKVEERFRSKKSVRRFTYKTKSRDALTTVGIFQAAPQKPRHAPQPQRDRTKKDRPYQVWHWQNTVSDTVDILVVRSPHITSDEREDIRFDVQLNQSSASFLCDASVDVGFARCKKAAGEVWQSMAGFNLGLKLDLDKQPV